MKEGTVAASRYREKCLRDQEIMKAESRAHHAGRRTPDRESAVLQKPTQGGKILPLPQQKRGVDRGVRVHVSAITVRDMAVRGPDYPDRPSAGPNGAPFVVAGFVIDGQSAGAGRSRHRDRHRYCFGSTRRWASSGAN